MPAAAEVAVGGGVSTAAPAGADSGVAVGMVEAPAASEVAVMPAAAEVAVGGGVSTATPAGADSGVAVGMAVGMMEALQRTATINTERGMHPARTVNCVAARCVPARCRSLPLAVRRPHAFVS